MRWIWVAGAICICGTAADFIRERVMMNRLLRGQRLPPPPQLTIQVIRYPAGGSAPHKLNLRNTTVGVDSSMYNFLRHSPDFQPYWGNHITSAMRDIQRMDMENQESPNLNGVYYFFYVMNSPGEPVNMNRPRFLSRLNISFTGDLFLAKVTNMEHRPDGYADFDTIPDELLNHYQMQVSTLE